VVPLETVTLHCVLVVLKISHVVTNFQVNDMAECCVDRLVRLRRDDWSHQGYWTTRNSYYLSSLDHELVAGLYREL